jgi:hypothetical protein
MTLSATVCSQNYTLPSVLFDSLVYETIKGRKCDSLAARQATELTKYYLLDSEQGRAIELLRSENKGLFLINRNWQVAFEAERAIRITETKSLRKEKQRLKLGLGVTVILLIISVL